MSTLFIADVHLSKQQPAITAGFVKFLANEASKADSLYILGDLFESWIGDDDPNPLHNLIADALNSLTQCGVCCYFIHGNRDFLLGSEFASKSGMILLPEKKTLICHEHKLLILHGDILCTDDISYQNFRKKVRYPLIQQLFLCLPLKLRLSIAALMRSKSQQAGNRNNEDIMDVNPHAVVQLAEEYDINWIIHGHTHRPAIHQIKPGMHSVHRAVLGAWDDTTGSMIKVSAGAVELIQFSY